MTVSKNNNTGLRESLNQTTAENRLLNTAFESLPQAVCIYDATGRLLFANRQYAELYRLPHDRLVPGMRWDEIITLRIENGMYAGGSPDDYMREREAWIGEPTLSAVHDLADGRTISVTRRFLPDGGWLTTHEDISEQLSLKRDLRKSTERYKLLLENLSVVPWEFDWATQKFLYIGPQASRFGYPIEDWFEEGFWPRTIHPDDREDAIDLCVNATERGEDHEFEYRMLKADGGVCWVRDIVSVTKQGDEPPKLQGVFIDVTERKQIEEALRKSQALFKDIAETASDWFWETDEDHRFTYISKRLEEVTGVSTKRFLGRTRAEVAEDAPGIVEHQADLDARRSFRDFCYELPGDGGEPRYWSISGRPIYEDGVFKGYRGSGRDRTAEELAEQEAAVAHKRLQGEVARATSGLRAQTEQLERALMKEKELVEVQRQFIAMASHEFRTPLAVIDGSVQRMLRRKSEPLPDDVAKRARSIRKAVATMTSLMESTLTAARMDAGETEINIQPCSLRDLLSDLCDRHRELNEEHILQCDLTALPERIEADATALEQIFTNLLSNAVKYSPKGPDIAVKGWQDAEFAVISVQDRGLGIDDDEIPQLFSRFFRARTSTGIPGTGIGLNLVKSLVELHGGKVRVDSRKGQGSTFTLRLPLEGPRRNGRKRSRGQAA